MALQFSWLLVITVACQAQERAEIRFPQEEYFVEESADILQIFLNVELNKLQYNESFSVVVGVSPNLSDDQLLAKPYNVLPPDYVLNISDPQAESFVVIFSGESDMSTSHDIVIVGDNLYEGREFFYLEIMDIFPESVRNLTILSSERVPVTIEDDDVLSLNFSQEILSANEGDKSVTLTAIIYEGILERPLEVEILCFGPNPRPGVSPAVLGKDYSVPHTSLVWKMVQENPPQSATVKLKLIDDQIAEETESFVCVIKLSRSENNKLQVTDPDTVTITLFDDDVLFVNWSSALYIADEKMEQVLLSLNALPGFSSLFSVSALASPYARVEGLPLLFTIDGYNGLLQRATPRRATNEDEFVDDSVDFDNANSKVFRFSEAGSTIAMNVFSFENDDILEYDEVFQVGFMLPQSVSFEVKEAQPSVANVIIRDDDNANVSFVESKYSVGESDDNVTLQVVLTGYHAMVLNVSLECGNKSVDGSAQASIGEDYQDTIAILSFPSHITGSAVVSKSFSVDILSDLLLEGDEQFVCEIVMVSHERVHIGPNSRVLVTIVDDDFEAIPCTLTDGSMVDDGTRFKSGEPCMQDCTCKRGVFVCPKITCPTCDENAKVLPAPDGECCDVCACPYKGRDFMPGATFAFGDGCNTCNCLIDGTRSCTSDDCELMPECSHDLCVNLTDEEQINTYCYIDANVSLGSIQYVHPSHGCFPVTTCASCYYNKQEKAIPRRCTTTEFKCRVQAFNRQRCLNRLGNCITKHSRYANVPDKRKIPDRFRCFLNKKRGTSSK